MNIRIPLLATLFGGILTVSTQAQTITAPTGQNLTITNAIDVTGVGNSVNIPSDGTYKIGGVNALRTKGYSLLVGDGTGNALTTGDFNSFIGYGAGFKNTTGSNNAFSGIYAGNSNTTGNGNVYFGTNAGFYNQIGNFNVFFGFNSGSNTISNGSTFFGTNSGLGNTSGLNNIAFGYNAGLVNKVGNYNLFLGSFADASVDGLSNAVAIGTSAIVSASNTIVLGQGATTVTGQGLGVGLSGLKFANLTSGSASTPVGGNKVLSVDGAGNVVLVTLASGTINSVGGPVAEKTWKDEGGYLYNNSTNGVVINGTGLDGNSLIVKGGVLSKEVNVKVEGSESWPDYVFKPSYKRMTLDEVEKFININGHLPNVASATEMAVTGNNLNKTDIKLLEKVEELTLYLLEMKKANEVQNAEIQNLKKQVKSLRKK